jgi:hypothetical protein
MNKVLIFLIEITVLPLILSSPVFPQSPAPTDEDVQKALAQMDFPNWVRRPNVEDFRASKISGADGKLRPATLDEFIEQTRLKTLPYTFMDEFLDQIRLRISPGKRSS